MAEMKTLTINDVRYDITDANAIKFTEQTLTEEQKAQARENIGAVTGTTIIEPAEDDIPKVFFGAALPQTKLYASMSFRYISKTADISGYCKTKAQGNYSMQFDKKNQTVKLYKDEACTEKLKINFKDWGKQSKFCFKANWVDPTHARNIICANLWNEVVSSRDDYETLPIELQNSPRNGAIDGFPVKLYADGIYQGVYTLNIPKDDWMVGMDEDNPNHVLLCAETNTNGVYAENACNFRALWSGVDGEHWSVEVGTNSEAVKNSLNALISCVKDTDDITFKSTIGTYLDVQSAIDYYIFQYIVNGTDGLAKNMLLATYDGVKWYCGAYDMDGTFYPPVNNPCPSGYGEQFSRLWERISSLYANELSARYKELRKTVYSVANMVGKFDVFMDKIGDKLYVEDAEIFPDLPTGELYTIEHFRDYIRKRLIYCDSQLGMADEPMYRLGEEIVVDTTTSWTGYQDTKIKLFDEPKSFTLVCEVTLDNDCGTYRHVWSCTNEYLGLENPSNGGAFFQAKTHPDGGLYFTGVQNSWNNPIFGSYNAGQAAIKSRYSKHAIVVENGVPVALYYITEKNGAVQRMIPTEELSYVQHDGTLCLGMAMYSYGGDNLMDGTIHNFEIWDYAMSRTEVIRLLDGYIDDDAGDDNNYEEYGLLYRLPQETIFDGVDDYIDTEVKLLDEPKDFTIICDATKPTNTNAQVYNFFNNGNGDVTKEGGVVCCNNPSANTGIVITGEYDNGNVDAFFYINGVSIIRHALVFKNGVLDSLYYVANDGGEVLTANHRTPNGANPAYFQHNRTLQIGCGVGWYQTPQSFADMTVYNFEVWDYAMTAEEARVKLESFKY